VDPEPAVPLGARISGLLSKVRKDADADGVFA